MENKKILVIASSGKTGFRVLKDLIDLGANVTACQRSKKDFDIKEINYIYKDLFSLEKEDIKDFDVVVSLFGSGFNSDPKINFEAIKHLTDISNNQRLFIMGGAGCLYSDASKKTIGYEDEHHPAFLKEISRNTYLGYLYLKENYSNYTFVTPSLTYDENRVATNKFKVGLDMVPLVNKDNQSIIGYDDFAKALSTIIYQDDQKYLNKLITICEE